MPIGVGRMADPSNAKEGGSRHGASASPDREPRRHRLRTDVGQAIGTGPDGRPRPTRPACANRRVSARSPARGDPRRCPGRPLDDPGRQARTVGPPGADLRSAGRARGSGWRPTQGVTLPPAIPFTEVPLYGPLSIPAAAEDEGPPDGLTLDMAIERLVRENLDLRAAVPRDPQGAGRHPHRRACGPTRSSTPTASSSPTATYSTSGRAARPSTMSTSRYPLDVSHKRRARTAVAAQAKRVIEAQYQDAVRQQTRHPLHRLRRGPRRPRDRPLCPGQHARARPAPGQDAEAASRAARRRGRCRTDPRPARLGPDRPGGRGGSAPGRQRLAPLLQMNPIEAETIELRGTIDDPAPPPPPGEELVRIALDNRPDLVAARLGIRLAEADVRLARAERFQDVYVLAQPYTFQNNAPFDTKSAHSWALGVTVPLPIYNRNQGNIQRARVNVSQTRTQLAAIGAQGPHRGPPGRARVSRLPGRGRAHRAGPAARGPADPRRDRSAATTRAKWPSSTTCSPSANTTRSSASTATPRSGTVAACSP